MIPNARFECLLKPKCIELVCLNMMTRNICLKLPLQFHRGSTFCNQQDFLPSDLKVYTSVCGCFRLNLISFSTWVLPSSFMDLVTYVSNKYGIV